MAKQLMTKSKKRHLKAQLKKRLRKRLGRKQPSWSEMSAGKKAAVVSSGTVQMALAATAWRDLAKRPAERVNGKKGVWAAIIAVNWIGPIAYFLKGRQEAVA